MMKKCHITGLHNGVSTALRVLSGTHSCIAFAFPASIGVHIEHQAYRWSSIPGTATERFARGTFSHSLKAFEPSKSTKFIQPLLQTFPASPVLVHNLSNAVYRNADPGRIQPMLLPHRGSRFASCLFWSPYPTTGHRDIPRV